MRIRSFWAKGYRSLVDFRLDDLGERNVFYGPNGAGKSNIVAAIDTLFRLVSIRAEHEPGHLDAYPKAAEFAIARGVITERDRVGSADSRSPNGPSTPAASCSSGTKTH